MPEMCWKIGIKNKHVGGKRKSPIWTGFQSRRRVDAGRLGWDLRYLMGPLAPGQRGQMFGGISRGLLVSKRKQHAGACFAVYMVAALNESLQNS